MNTTALPRTLLRTLHVTVLAGAVGLAAVACAPTGTPAAASAPAIAAATETVADAAPTTAAPAATAPTTTAAATAATSVVAAAGTGTPAVGAPTVSAKTSSPAPVAAAGTGTPAVGAPTVSVKTILPAPVAAAPITAAAVPVAPVPMAVVVPAAAPAAATPPGGDGVAAQAARAVFDATNTFRQQNGVAPLVWNGALQRSAHQHNLAMATANQMSHQVPGERSFDTRISDQGVPWLSVGENVGFNTNRTVAGALTLHTMMINETAPNDDHKVNKLDPKFNVLGVDVLLDPTTGKLWLTEDYAQV